MCNQSIFSVHRMTMRGRKSWLLLSQNAVIYPHIKDLCKKTTLRCCLGFNVSNSLTDIATHMGRNTALHLKQNMSWQSVMDPLLWLLLSCTACTYKKNMNKSKIRNIPRYSRSYLWKICWNSFVRCLRFRRGISEL